MNTIKINLLGIFVLIVFNIGIGSLMSLTNNYEIIAPFLVSVLGNIFIIFICREDWK